MAVHNETGDSGSYTSELAADTGHAGDYRRLHSWMLVVILGLAPLPLGSIHPWAMTLLSTLVILQLALLLPSVLNSQHRWYIPKSLIAAAMLVTGVVIWIKLQFVAGFGSEFNSGIWAKAADYGLEAVPRIAMAADGGEFESIRLLTALGVFLIAFTLGQSRNHARFILHALFWIIFAYALLGLFQLIVDVRISERIIEHSRLTASFVNANHAATFLNIGLVIGLAMLIEPTFFQHNSSAKERWTTLFVRTISSLFEERPLLTFAVGLIFVCSIATWSRAGFFSFLLAALFLLYFGLRSSAAGRIRGWPVILATVLVLAGLTWFGGSGLLARFDDIGRNLDITTAGRVAVYGLSLELIAERPWTGYGYGLFDHLFALNRDERFYLFFDYAHNDWLQLAAEIGLPATFAFWLACFLVFLVCLKGIMRRSRGKLPSLIGASVFIQIAVHALLDFSLAMPAIMCLTNAVIALGCAQAQRKSVPGTNERATQQR